ACHRCACSSRTGPLSAFRALGTNPAAVSVVMASRASGHQAREASGGHRSAIHPHGVSTDTLGTAQVSSVAASTTVVRIQARWAPRTWPASQATLLRTPKVAAAKANQATLAGVAVPVMTSTVPI